MPEEKKKAAPIVFSSIPDDPVEFKRQINGTEVGWTFKKGILRKKSETAPDRFALRPVRPKDDAERGKLLEFAGLELGSESFYRQTANFAVRWTFNSCDVSSGVFVPEEFAKCVATYSARGETLKALRDEKEELNTEIIQVNRDTTMNSAQKAVRYGEIAARIAEIQDAIDHRTRDDEEETADATP